MTSDKICLADEGESESIRSEEEGEELNNLELWTEEAIDIETPFTTAAQDDIEYLKLEITELKQILISLAEKYKLSEDRRKVAERRNSFLKADNVRLQQMSDCSLSQKIEAELENRRTLDKLREFIDFKREFERQADLLKKIICHLPRMKNASTSCSIYSGPDNYYEMKPIHHHNNNTNYSNSLPLIPQCSGDNNDIIKTESSITKKITAIDYNKIVIDEDTETKCNDRDIVSKDLAVVDLKNDDKPNENRKKINQENRSDVIHQDYIDFNEGVTKIWNPKNPKEDQNTAWIGTIRTTKSRANLTKLKQEVLALKNMNNWKTNDLEFKSRQLVVKNRELSEAKKEITQLKMQVNKLILDQQKRVSSHHHLAYNSKINLLQLSKSKIRQEQHSPRKRTSSIEAKRNKSQHQVSSTAMINKNEAKRNKSLHGVASASLTKIENNSDKLPVSNESVWREIAPGDQVRIKVKRQLPG